MQLKFAVGWPYMYGTMHKWIDSTSATNFFFF
jgi:hypothetical protein